MSPLSEKTIRITLGILLLIIAINAFGGGYYGMSGAKDMPLEWLAGSPFKNYFVPSLFLFFGIGGSCLLAAIAVFKKHRLAGIFSLFCGLLIISWLVVQVAIIGYVSWMQPTTAIFALLIILLTGIHSKGMSDLKKENQMP
jgi:hypothetical protein